VYYVSIIIKQGSLNMKVKKPHNQMKHVRKAVPPCGFDFKDKSKYNRTKKHKEHL